MGIHKRFKQTESGGCDVSNQWRSRCAGGDKGREERIGGSPRANSPVSPRDVRDADHSAGVRYHAFARVLRRRDLEPRSQKSLQLAGGKVRKFRGEGQKNLRGRAFPEDAKGKDSFLCKGRRSAKNLFTGASKATGRENRPTA